MFRSTPKTFPVPFVQGNVFDPQHIAPAPPLHSPPTTPRPDLSKLTSLTPLQGHVSAIHTSRFFHLFSKEDQIKAARALASLLSPESGSMILGEHAGLPQKGWRSLEGTVPGMSHMFCHSPESWKDLWGNIVFRPHTVRVEADLLEVTEDQRRAISSDAPREGEVRWYRIRWCVTRL